MNLKSLIYGVVTATVTSAITIQEPVQATIPALSPRGSSLIFTATDRRIGCSPGGCLSSYNISATENYIPNVPGFSFRCFAVNGRQSFEECTALTPVELGASLWNKVVGITMQTDLITVYHTFVRGGLRWNVTASGEVDHNASTFTVPVIDLSVLPVSA
jgi:hypothetical protein